MYFIVTDPEAGAIDGGLGIEAPVDKSGHQLDVALRLHEGAHDAEGPEEVPVPEEQPRDDRVEGAAPGLDATGYCEAGAAILEDDPCTGRDDARAEVVVEALDEGDGHAALVHDTEIDRAAERLGHRGDRIPSAALEERTFEEGSRVGTVSDVRQSVAESQADAFDLISEGHLAEVEQPESLQGCDALSGGWELEHGDVPVADSQRLDPARFVAGEILFLEPARVRDRPCHLARVDCRRSFLGNQAQCLSELGEAEVPAGPRRLRELRRAPGLLPGKGGHDSRRDAALGRVDRIGEASVEPEAAEPLRERGPAGDRARDRDGPGAMLLDRLQGAGGGRSRPGGVEADGFAVPPDDCEGIPADSRRHRLRDAEHPCGCERGVDRVPAPLERAKPGPSGERLARGDHGVRGHGRGPGWSRAPGHRARIADVPTLYDAARCPYCARVRILLAEKGVPYAAVEVDLDDRPAWIYRKNSTGRVPVLEEDEGLMLPESKVIMEYLEERFPEPPLWPADAAARALARLLLERFDDLSDPYYDLLKDRPGASVERLRKELAKLDGILESQPFLTGADYGLADVGYLPWILRIETRLGVDLAEYSSLAAWLERVAERPSVRAEIELLAIV
jgi:glutathione S-transferase